MRFLLAKDLSVQVEYIQILRTNITPLVVPPPKAFIACRTWRERARARERALAVILYFAALIQHFRKCRLSQISMMQRIV